MYFVLYSVTYHFSLSRGARKEGSFLSLIGLASLAGLKIAWATVFLSLFRSFALVGKGSIEQEC